MSNEIALRMPQAPVKTDQPSRSRLKTIARYEAKLAERSAKWTKGEIQGLTKLLNSAEWEHSETIKSLLNDLQYAAHNNNFEHRITAEQTALGIEWLKRNMLTVKGTPKALMLKALDQPSSGNFFRQDAIETLTHVIKTFSKFRFVGVHIERNEYSEWHYPIYRTYSRDGSYFDYVPLHWNAPIILDIHRA